MIRTLGLLLVLLLVGLFALLNWPAFSALTPLSLGFMTVQAPLGVIMLGAIVFLALLFTVWAISMQASALAETRRQTRALQAQRELADKAEASRFTELQQFMAAEMLSDRQAALQAQQALLARLDRVEQEARRAVDESGNSLAAALGEIEDRLERQNPLPVLERPPISSR
jgi:uncharacterized integral membrane protein